VTQPNPDITGWGLIGGWPLFTENALKWQPGAVQCVGVDALPICLNYLRSGHVQVLLAQHCLMPGGIDRRSTSSTRCTCARIRRRPRMPAPLVRVDRSNVEADARNWEKWLPKWSGSRASMPGTVGFMPPASASEHVHDHGDGAAMLP
jgi:ribose transport system substrate-binding protein